MLLRCHKFLPPSSSLKPNPNRLYILPPSLVRKSNPTLSSWCSAAQSRRWWLKRRTLIPSPMCVSQPDPCPMKVPNIVVPKWVSLVIYSIFWCNWVEGWRMKRNGEKWWWRGPLLLLGVKGLELIKAIGGVWVKSNAWGDNPLTVGPLHVCVFKKWHHNSVFITQKHLKLVFSFYNSLLKNVRIEWWK